MGTAICRVFGRFGGAIALSLGVMAVAACGGASKPPTSAPEATAPSASSAATGEKVEQSDAESSAPSAMMAPTFELPNAAGETISLASYAGDKNVVLVFYRGFW